MNVVYKTLVGDQLAQLEPQLQRAGWSIPHPKLATAVVAECDGVIIGFTVIQMIPHAEPLFVEPQFRGTGVAEDLADKAVQILRESGAKGWLAVAQNTFAEQLCERVGMKPIAGVLYRKEQ